jgi:phosphoribosyl 1,2-cyclic phosphate phosphodiesterase
VKHAFKIVLMMIEITILGCGSSGGVPRIGSGWGACDPLEPKNKRTRCSLLIKINDGAGDHTILIDTSPDLREQLLRHDVKSIDVVFYTHEHADHVHGIDDLRALVQHMKRKMPVYADPLTAVMLQQRFGYCFEQAATSSYPSICDLHLFEDEKAFTLTKHKSSITVLPILMHHGEIDAYAFKIKNTIYACDVNKIPEHNIENFKNLDLLIIDALRYTPHPTHFSVADALDFIERVQPKRAVLTNLHTDLDYHSLKQQLPLYIEPAYDGMVLYV